MCQFDQGEYLHANKCICIKPSGLGKRSIDEHDPKHDPNQDELESHTEGVIKLRPGSIGLKSVVKRHVKTIHMKHPGKREVSPLLKFKP